MENGNENKLFREKSLERISSPEQLQDYMRVTNPGIWMVLAAVIILLVGGIVCACMGKLETTKNVRATALNGTVTAEFPASEEEQIEAGMTIRVSGQEGKIRYVYEKEAGIVTCTADMELPDGSYDAQIVTETISPISFLIN